ncbi:hypothetical protein D5400_16300 [Georhizobium profundi]|jgi:hypothetical protein|uniref:Uncharacterized protein n=1 Tax=Georhizobium profundi TaxID=2341112 RepID=A0A3S9B6S9_9HYPH|nr:hypothetical protein [Georhizobium profundi]AZN72623.1 hypothetical protein D5400_16300 [Georhizobium profundi]
MNAWNFRIRSRDRDKETDRRRLDRLAELSTTLFHEVRRESDGIRRRYEAAVGDAAFAMEAQAAESDQRKLEGRIDDLTDTVLSCEARLRDLDVQAEFYQDILQRIATYRSSSDV